MEDKEITQLDIVTAFLESGIDEKLYLKLPKYFVISRGGKVELEVHDPGGRVNKSDEQVVVNWKMSLYGLGQVGHNWYHALESYLIERRKVKPSLYEAGIYISQSGASIIKLLDDLLLSGTKREVVEMKKRIRERFYIKDLRNFKYFLSMPVERDRERGALYLSQQTYLTKILRTFSMENCKRSSTALNPKTKMHQKNKEKGSTNLCI